LRKALLKPPDYIHLMEMSYVRFGVPIIDELLPEGFPRNSFILLFGEGGTGKSVALSQAAGARIRAGEPCVYVIFDDSPTCILEEFSRRGINYREAMDNDTLIIIDCFSFRSRTFQKADEAIRVVANPRDHHTLTGDILSAATTCGGNCSVFIDSLTEFFTLSEPTSALETVKNWRAELCKAMNMTLIATYHVGIKSVDDLAAMLDYLMDGIIDFRFDPSTEPRALLSQLRVRKMKRSIHDTEWHSFLIEKEGLVKKPRAAHKLTAAGGGAGAEDSQR